MIKELFCGAKNTCSFNELTQEWLETEFNMFKGGDERMRRGTADEEGEHDAEHAYNKTGRAGD